MSTVDKFRRCLTWTWLRDSIWKLPRMTLMSAAGVQVARCIGYPTTHPSLLFIHLFMNQNGSSIKILRSDQGTEYVNALTKEWIQKMGILHEMSAPYTAEQNGTSERTNRTIMESARSMMVFSRAPPEFWAEAVTYSAYIRNRIPSGEKIETPYQIIFKLNRIYLTLEYLAPRPTFTFLMWRGKSSTLSV